MDKNDISKILKQTFSDISCAKIDHHRHIRNGFSEVIFCEGKRVEHLLSIFKGNIEAKRNIFATRASEETAVQIIKEFPDVVYDPVGRTMKLIHKKTEKIDGTVAVLAAGTADLQVAQEACNTLSFFGVEPNKFYDVGIAGLPRLFSCIEDVKDHDVIIAIAGMEGALPSVTGGLVSIPIIAVPTSVGYGTNLSGFTPLFAMLNSCSEGIVVVNIDNGFGAACAALRILRHR